MNKRKFIFVSLILVVFLLCLVGCMKNNSDKNINENYQEDETPIVNTDENAELYVSTKGYEIRYDSKKFKIKYEDSIEKFVLNSESGDVYLKIYFIESGDDNIIQSIKEKSNKQGNCIFADGDLVGVYFENKLPEENDRGMVEKNFIFDLYNEKTVIMETKMYSRTEKEQIENEWIYQMINSFKYVE